MKKAPGETKPCLGLLTVPVFEGALLDNPCFVCNEKDGELYIDLSVAAGHHQVHSIHRKCAERYLVTHKTSKQKVHLGGKP